MKQHPLVDKNIYLIPLFQDLLLNIKISSWDLDSTVYLAEPSGYFIIGLKFQGNKWKIVKGITIPTPFRDELFNAKKDAKDKGNLLSDAMLKELIHGWYKEVPAIGKQKPWIAVRKKS